MNRLTKFIRSLAALLAGVAMVAPLGAWADTWTDESGNVWTYRGSKVTAVSFETTNLVIPDTLGGNPVTAFNADVFNGKDVVRVTIPATVMEIPPSAFAGCGNLRSVTILGEGLTTIGAAAFRGCKNLSAFDMPNSVTSLGKGAFSGCAKLESVTLSDGLAELPSVPYYGTGTRSRTISSGTYSGWTQDASLAGEYDDGLFYNCTSLKTINWGKGLKTIGNIAFLNCLAMESVVIPDTVTAIGNHAFLGCSSLETVTIGNGVTSIGEMAFRGLPSLMTVTFGTNIVTVGAQAFQDCANLRNFTLPSTTQHINYRAFAGCKNALTSVTIPTNKDGQATELQKGVFSGCTKLAEVTLGDTVEALPSVPYYGTGTRSRTISSGTYSGWTQDASLAGEYDDGFFYNCTSLKTINWGKGLKTIGNIAFLNCSALESVVIPDTVTMIRNHAFLGCSSLGTVMIGNGVTYIGEMAFRDLPNLAIVKFGTKVVTIDAQAFQDCINLQNFELPSTIQHINYRAFAGCKNALTSVTIPTNKDGLTTELQKGVFSGCTKLAEVTFGDTVEELPSVPYYGTGTRSRTISSGTYSGWTQDASLAGEYDDGLFYNCTSLKTVNWGNGIREIGNVAFLDCTALSDLMIPATVQVIGKHAFARCTSLKTVTVMGRVTTLGCFAFAGCNALHYVDFQGSRMTAEPELTPFAFNSDRFTVYAAPNSSGWTGVVGEQGLPADGMWCDVRITYAPPPEGAGNPYDFCLATPKARINSIDYNWPAPFMVTTNRYVHGNTIPQSVATIREGDPVYLSYAFDEYWRGEAFVVTNRFTLSGAKNDTIDFGVVADAHATFNAWWRTNAVPEQLQNLEPGEYTLTLQLNGDNRLKETDYANNTTSITFTVVGTSRYMVTFNANGGSVSPTTRTVASGSAVGTLPDATRSGYTFDGWFTSANGGTEITSSTKVTANVTYYAHWTRVVAPPPGPIPPKPGDPIQVTIIVIINNLTIETINLTVIYGNVWGTNLPLPRVRPGWTFVGWFTGENGTGTRVTATTIVSEATTQLYAYYVKDDEPVVSYYLYDSVAGVVPQTMASVYDGYLYNKSTGALAGTIQVKVGKPNAKTHLASVKATVIGLDGKKKSLKAVEKGKALIQTNSPTTFQLVGGDACEVTLGSKGMVGEYGNYFIDGALNVFTSKDAADKATAAAVLGKWQGVVNVAWRSDATERVPPYQTLSVSIANKGKAKVAGTLADGTKVSASSQLLVGDEWYCVPVLEPKKSHLAFVLWLPADATGRVPPVVVGLADAIVGKPGTLKSGAEFRMDEVLGDAKYAKYLPDGLTVAQNGTKWVVAGGAKAGKVQLAKDGSGSVDETKTGDNPSALKLTYTAKTGAFKGSFKAYSDVNGKPKGVTVNVTGVLVDGVGYSTATIKKVVSAPVMILLP